MHLGPYEIADAVYRCALIATVAAPTANGHPLAVPPTYDRIGQTYSRTRVADPRFADRILRALGDAATVLNVGAGAGSYEPTDRSVVALDPSRTMLRQRSPGAAPAVQGVVEHLPFADRSFDVVMGTFTVHHWRDLEAGVRELSRVARQRVVILTFDRAVSHRFWLIAEYFPGIVNMPGDVADTVAPLEALLGVRAEPVLVPADCTDGFLAAFWNRPAAYLDAEVRAGMSAFHGLPPEELAHGLDTLRADLASGAWEARHGDLLAASELEAGYRLLVAQLS